MNERPKQILALIGMSCASILVLLVLTAPSRARLHTARELVVQLEEYQASLQARMSRKEATVLRRVSLPAELIWPGADDAIVEIAQGKALVDAAGLTGLKVVSFGASQAPKGLGTPEKAYEIEVEGGHGEVAAFLAAVEQHRPRLAISYLWLRQIPLSTGQTFAPVSLRLTVWGFHDGSAVKE